MTCACVCWTRSTFIILHILYSRLCTYYAVYMQYIRMYACPTPYTTTGQQQQDATMATSSNMPSTALELPVVAGVVASVVFISLLILVVCVAVIVSTIRGRRAKKGSEGNSSSDGSTAGLAGREENGVKLSGTEAPSDTMGSEGKNTGTTQHTVKVEVFSKMKEHAEDNQELARNEAKEEENEKQAVTDL